MSNQQNPPRNQLDAEATEKGWRHPQTGELLVSVKGLDISKRKDTSSKTEFVVDDFNPETESSETLKSLKDPILEIETTSLEGVQPHEVVVIVSPTKDIAECSIHWGDGSPDTAVDLSELVEFKHTYPTVGECTLKVTAKMTDGTSETISNIVKIVAKKVVKAKVKDEEGKGAK